MFGAAVRPRNVFDRDAGHIRVPLKSLQFFQEGAFFFEAFFYGTAIIEFGPVWTASRKRNLVVAKTFNQGFRQIFDICREIVGDGGRLLFVLSVRAEAHGGVRGGAIWFVTAGSLRV